MSNNNSDLTSIFTDHAAGASFESDAFSVPRAESAAVQVGNIASVDLVGSMKIQVTNDESLGWNDLPDSTQAFAKVSAIGVSNIWDLTQFGFKKFRFVWTYTSGSGTLSANLHSKG